MLKPFIKFLKTPYPAAEGEVKEFMLSLLAGLFVFGFLSFFRPFGLDNITNIKELLYISGGYGTVTFLGTLLILLPGRFLFPSFFKEETWTIGKEFLTELMVLTLISIGNAFWAAHLGSSSISFAFVFYFFLITIAIGVFPITFFILYRQHKMLTKYRKEATQLNSILKHPLEKEKSQSEILLNNTFSDVVDFSSAPNVKETIITNEAKSTTAFELANSNTSTYIQSQSKDNYDRVVAIMAAGNYVEWFEIEESIIRADNIHKAKPRLMRKTVQEVLVMLDNHPDFIHIHRSFIINRRFIESIEGNSQGLKVKMHYIDNFLSVSRNRVAVFKKMIG